MAATFELVAGVKDEAYGSFSTGIFVWEGSSSDPVKGGAPRPTVQVRDVLAGFPLLWWKVEASEDGPMIDRLLEVIGHAQAMSLGAVEFDWSTGLPLAPGRVESATLRQRVARLAYEAAGSSRRPGFPYRSAAGVVLEAD